MRSVGTFLKRFQNLTAPERSVRSAVELAIKDVVGLEVDGATIKVSKSTLYINLSSVIKSAIFEEKTNIISRANNILGKDQIKDLK